MNFIIGCESPINIPVNGTTSDWHNFWSGYLGTLIGAGISFIILSRTIKSNHYENMINRQDHFRTLEHQLHLNKIENYKTAINTVMTAFSPFHLEQLYLLIKDRHPSKDRDNYAKELFASINNATNIFRIALTTTDLDETEEAFKNEFENMRIIYADIIRDILWVSKMATLEYDQYDNPTRESIKKSIEQYKQDNSNQLLADSHRIWKVISRIEINPENYSDAISKELLSHDISDLFYDTALKFLKYENHKATIILNEE